MKTIKHRHLEIGQQLLNVRHNTTFEVVAITKETIILERYELKDIVQLKDLHKKYNILRRPMSDMIKPLTFKGKTFIPLEVISSISIEEENAFELDGVIPVMWEVMLSMSAANVDYWQVRHLVEWDFDIDDMIGKGFAVNVNSACLHPTVRIKEIVIDAGLDFGNDIEKSDHINDAGVYLTESEMIDKYTVEPINNGYFICKNRSKMLIIEAYNQLSILENNIAGRDVCTNWIDFEKLTLDQKMEKLNRLDKECLSIQKKAKR